MKTQRLSINLSAETASTLQKLKANKGISVTEIVRNAIAVYDFFEEEVSQGRNVQTSNKDGSGKTEIHML